MPKKNRSFKLVSEEYDQRVYRHFLSMATDISPISVHKMIYGSDKLRHVKLNKYKVITDSEYNFEKYKMLYNQISSAESIVELGAGFGRNLFGLRNLGFSGDLYALEISPNAVQLGKKINKITQSRVNFFCQDLIDEFIDLPQMIPDSNSNIVLSYQFFEQIPKDLEKCISHILQIFPKSRFIFIESASELFPKTFSDVLTKLYIYKQNYQKNIYKTLIKLQREGKIQLDVERYKCSGKYGHENALYRVSNIR